MDIGLALDILVDLPFEKVLEAIKKVKDDNKRLKERGDRMLKRFDECVDLLASHYKLNKELREIGEEKTNYSCKPQNEFQKKMRGNAKVLTEHNCSNYGKKMHGNLEENGFFVVSESYANYPTTLQSLSASLNMEYVNYLTEKVGIESKNFRMLNQILSDNKVMQKLHAEGYNIINMGSLWGPNNEFKNVNANICEFKEINRDSLLRELLQTSMSSYLQEMWTYEVSRDRVSCIFDELSTLDQEYSNPKFVFAHIMLPHGPYIFGPNGEDVNPGISLDGKPWDPKKAHIDQL